MENSLILTPKTRAKELFEKYFLCVTIVEEELPWDIKNFFYWR
jgi:hypothetical protein